MGHTVGRTDTSPMHKRLLLEAASVKNNSAFSYYVRWQRGTARIRPLHAGRAAIDRYFLQQLTCSSGHGRRHHRTWGGHDPPHFQTQGGQGGT